jgi:putative anaerobic ribonucleoside-triphosphate reductase activating protein
MQDLYFKNHEAKIIFGLVVLGGKPQMDLLGIDYSHYSDKKIAEIWYSNIKDVLVNSNHVMKDVALENLEKLYKSMKK